MYIVLLTFSNNKAQASQFMDGHNAWLKQGFDDKVFILAGSLQPQRGGAVLAHNCTADELQNRINSDPFVQEDIVTTETLEISPAKAIEQLDFLVS